MDIEEIIASIRMPERTITLCLRGDLVAVWEQLERDLEAADAEISAEVDAAGGSARAAKLARQMLEVRSEMLAATRVFTLRAVPRPRWHELVDGNPPADGQRGEVNEESFGVAAVAACCADPAMSVQQAQRLRDAVTDGQWETLTDAVLRLNRTMPGVPHSLKAATRAAITT